MCDKNMTKWSNCKQGMSDLAAPLLVVMEEEVEAFWCFQMVMDQVISLSVVL